MVIIHPRIYFPMIVEEALMIEPTDTESKETLDEFIAVMRKIAQEAKEDASKLRMLLRLRSLDVWMKPWLPVNRL